MSRWFQDGLRFGCTQCGHCCTGVQGYVWLSPADQERIATHLGLGLDLFRKRYTRLVGRLLALVDKPNGDCIFLLENNQCAIHPEKPRQCLTFPFWPRIAQSRASWDEASETCPGMGTGSLYQSHEVEALLDRDTPRERLWRLAKRPS